MTGLRRRRTVLYATIGVALLVAVLVGVIASVQPSSDLGANTPLLGDPAPAISGPSLGGGHLSALRSYLAARKADWPAVDDPAASVPYGVTGLPSSFLVAPGGTVYAYVIGAVTASELDSWLRRGAAKVLSRAGA